MHLNLDYPACLSYFNKGPTNYHFFSTISKDVEDFVRNEVSIPKILKALYLTKFVFPHDTHELIIHVLNLFIALNLLISLLVCGILTVINTKHTDNGLIIITNYFKFTKHTRCALEWNLT